MYFGNISCIKMKHQLKWKIINSPVISQSSLHKKYNQNKNKKKKKNKQPTNQKKMTKVIKSRIYTKIHENIHLDKNPIKPLPPEKKKNTKYFVFVEYFRWILICKRLTSFLLNVL